MWIAVSRFEREVNDILTAYGVWEEGNDECWDTAEAIGNLALEQVPVLMFGNAAREVLLDHGYREYEPALSGEIARVYARYVEEASV